MGVFKTQNFVLQLQLLITFLQMFILNSKHNFSTAYTNAPQVFFNLKQFIIHLKFFIF